MKMNRGRPKKKETKKNHCLRAYPSMVEKIKLKGKTLQEILDSAIAMEIKK